MKDPKKILDHGQWSGDCQIEHKFDSKLAIALIEYFRKVGVRTVLDLGCGPGKYVSAFNCAGIESFGFDGNPDTSAPNTGVSDLAVELRDTDTWDAVISLEVGEHIPREYQHTFLSNVANNATAFVVLSWAIPGQGGFGHVNCQPNSYIIEEMKKLGFSFLPDESIEMRKHATFWWFKNTIMIFERD